MNTTVHTAELHHSLELIDEILPGDVIWVRFCDKSPEYALEALSPLVDDGSVTSDGRQTLRHEILYTNHDFADYRWLELHITDEFDVHTFRRYVATHIDQMKFIRTTIPLVDTAAALDAERLIRFRFKDDSVTGVLDLLNLHRAGVITISGYNRLRDAFTAERLDNQSRSGTFRSKLSDTGNELYRETFMRCVASNLMLLRK